MDYVIGSGLAGVACAKALLARGRDVAMLDPGVMLEPERERARAALASHTPEEWTPAQMATRTPATTTGGVPMFKLVHGSDYPYRTYKGAPQIDFRAPGIRSSHALGGLSNVWGGAMLPYREVDLETWPVMHTAMAEAYRAVLGYVPLAGREDALAADWPLYALPAADMPISRQAADMLARLDKRRVRGMNFGRARLAVHASRCVACGECLNGCPYDIIYSARQEMPALLAAGMRYYRGVSVHAIEESAAGIRVFASKGDVQRTYQADRVYLAAGVYSSTGILMRSLGLKHTVILDSQYFILPLLTASRIPNVSRERLHTLAQVFIELEDTSVTPHNVHLQVYGYSSALDAAMAHRLGLLRRCRRLLLERMMVVQGYLHSDQSGRLDATLSNDVLSIMPVRNPETDVIIKRVIRQIGHFTSTLRALPLTLLLQETMPGRGYHSGGSFPMRESPSVGETDPLGRPLGWKRVHVVDSSVFPNIPSATISLSVMANAWRIGHAS